MGIYLFFSALVKTHWNEATSSWKGQDYKSFVRLHITENGDQESSLFSPSRILTNIIFNVGTVCNRN